MEKKKWGKRNKETREKGKKGTRPHLVALGNKAKTSALFYTKRNDDQGRTLRRTEPTNEYGIL